MGTEFIAREFGVTYAQNLAESMIGVKFTRNSRRPFILGGTWLEIGVNYTQNLAESINGV